MLKKVEKKFRESMKLSEIEKITEGFHIEYLSDSNNVSFLNRKLRITQEDLPEWDLQQIKFRVLLKIIVIAESYMGEVEGLLQIFKTLIESACFVVCKAERDCMVESGFFFLSAFVSELCGYKQYLPSVRIVGDYEAATCIYVNAVTTNFLEWNSLGSKQSNLRLGLLTNIFHRLDSCKFALPTSLCYNVYRCIESFTRSNKHFEYKFHFMTHFTNNMTAFKRDTVFIDPQNGTLIKADQQFFDLYLGMIIKDESPEMDQEYIALDCFNTAFKMFSSEYVEPKGLTHALIMIKTVKHKTLKWALWGGIGKAFLHYANGGLYKPCCNDELTCRGSLVHGAVDIMSDFNKEEVPRIIRAKVLKIVQSFVPGNIMTVAMMSEDTCISTNKSIDEASSPICKNSECKLYEFVLSLPDGFEWCSPSRKIYCESDTELIDLVDDDDDVVNSLDKSNAGVTSSAALFIETDKPDPESEELSDSSVAEETDEEICPDNLKYPKLFTKAQKNRESEHQCIIEIDEDSSTNMKKTVDPNHIETEATSTTYCAEDSEAGATGKFETHFSTENVTVISSPIIIDLTGDNDDDYEVSGSTHKDPVPVCLPECITMSKSVTGSSTDAGENGYIDVTEQVNHDSDSPPTRSTIETGLFVNKNVPIHNQKIDLVCISSSHIDAASVVDDCIVMEQNVRGGMGKVVKSPTAMQEGGADLDSVAVNTPKRKELERICSSANIKFAISANHNSEDVSDIRVYSKSLLADAAKENETITEGPYVYPLTANFQSELDTNINKQFNEKRAKFAATPVAEETQEIQPCLVPANTGDMSSHLAIRIPLDSLQAETGKALPPRFMDGVLRVNESSLVAATNLKSQEQSSEGACNENDISQKRIPQMSNQLSRSLELATPPVQSKTGNGTSLTHLQQTTPLDVNSKHDEMFSCDTVRKLLPKKGYVAQQVDDNALSHISPTSYKATKPSSHAADDSETSSEEMMPMSPLTPPASPAMHYIYIASQATEVAPNHREPETAGESSERCNEFNTKLCAAPSQATEVAPNLKEPETDGESSQKCNEFNTKLCAAPSQANEVAPNLKEPETAGESSEKCNEFTTKLCAAPSQATEVAPNLKEPDTAEESSEKCNEFNTKLCAAPSQATEVAPNLKEPETDGESSEKCNEFNTKLCAAPSQATVVAPNLKEPETDGESSQKCNEFNTKLCAAPSQANEVAPNLKEPETAGESSEKCNEFTTKLCAAPSQATEVAPNHREPETAGESSERCNEFNTKLCAAPSQATEVAPNLKEPETDGESSQKCNEFNTKLCAAPSQANEVAPNLKEPETAGESSEKCNEFTTKLCAAPSQATEVAPNLKEPDTAEESSEKCNEFNTKLCAAPSQATEVAPNLKEPDTAGESSEKWNEFNTKSCAAPSLATGVEPNFKEPETAGESSEKCNEFKTKSCAAPSQATEVAPNVKEPDTAEESFEKCNEFNTKLCAAPSQATEVAPNLKEPETEGESSEKCNEFNTKLCAAPSQATEVAPNLKEPDTAGESSEMCHELNTKSYAASFQATEVEPNLKEPETAGESSEKCNEFNTKSCAAPSQATEVAPNLKEPETDGESSEKWNEFNTKSCAAPSQDTEGEHAVFRRETPTNLDAFNCAPRKSSTPFLVIQHMETAPLLQPEHDTKPVDLRCRTISSVASFSLPSSCIQMDWRLNCDQYYAVVDEDYQKVPARDGDKIISVIKSTNTALNKIVKDLTDNSYLISSKTVTSRRSSSKTVTSRRRKFCKNFNSPSKDEAPVTGGVEDVLEEPMRRIFDESSSRSLIGLNRNENEVLQGNNGRARRRNRSNNLNIDMNFPAPKEKRRRRIEPSMKLPRVVVKLDKLDDTDLKFSKRNLRVFRDCENYTYLKSNMCAMYSYGEKNVSYDDCYLLALPRKKIRKRRSSCSLAMEKTMTTSEDVSATSIKNAISYLSSEIKNCSPSITGSLKNNTDCEPHQEKSHEEIKVALNDGCIENRTNRKASRCIGDTTSCRKRAKKSLVNEEYVKQGESHNNYRNDTVHEISKTRNLKISTGSSSSLNIKRKVKTNGVTASSIAANEIATIESKTSGNIEKSVKIKSFQKEETKIPTKPKGDDVDASTENDSTRKCGNAAISEGDENETLDIRMRRIHSKKCEFCIQKEAGNVSCLGRVDRCLCFSSSDDVPLAIVRSAHRRQYSAKSSSSRGVSNIISPNPSNVRKRRRSRENSPNHETERSHHSRTY